MLKRTLAHLPGIGECTERKLWEQGLRSWLELARAAPGDLPGRLRRGQWRAALEASIEQYERRAWRYFDEQLPSALKWRAFDELGDQAHYVDIETSGYDNEITVIGVYHAGTYHSFVAGINLDDARAYLENAELVVTYNGGTFDMPLIRTRFPNHLFNHIHIDLMLPLRRLGLTGGLKQIERKMGLTRSETTSHLSGWDAVYLWQDYQRGQTSALERLLVYNEEDVRNLEPLMRWAFETLSRSLTGPGGAIHD